MITINVESKQHQCVGKAAFIWSRSLPYRCPSLFRSYEIINAVMSSLFVKVEGVGANIFTLRAAHQTCEAV